MGRRPGLVVQNDLLNDSKLNTVIVIAITSTLKFGELPGNVRLHKGEANLPKPSVINMTQIKTVDKLSLKDFIPNLSHSCDQRQLFFPFDSQLFYPFFLMYPLPLQTPWH